MFLTQIKSAGTSDPADLLGYHLFQLFMFRLSASSFTVSFSGHIPARSRAFQFAFMAFIVFPVLILPIMSSLKALIFQAFSNLLPHRNRAKSDEQSWYPVLNSYRWVHFIKHPLINDYKGYFPSVSL